LGEAREARRDRRCVRKKNVIMSYLKRKNVQNVSFAVAARLEALVPPAAVRQRDRFPQFAEEQVVHEQFDRVFSPKGSKSFPAAIGLLRLEVIYADDAYLVATNQYRAVGTVRQLLAFDIENKNQMNE
jgi:hypothetical protein